VRPDRMPVFFLQSSGDLTYGLPDMCGSGVKAASHLSGGDLASADEPRAEVSDDEKASLRAILQRYVPAAAGEVNRTSLPWSPAWDAYEASRIPYPPWRHSSCLAARSFVIERTSAEVRLRFLAA
jgi:hypothetical protein